MRKHHIILSSQCSVSSGKQPKVLTDDPSTLCNPRNTAKWTTCLLPSYWSIPRGLKPDIMCLLTSSILRAGPLTPNLEVSNFIINITVSTKLASSSIASVFRLKATSRSRCRNHMSAAADLREGAGRRGGGGAALLILVKKEEITEGRKASKTPPPPPPRLDKGLDPSLVWCTKLPSNRRKPQKGNSFVRLKGTMGFMKNWNLLAVLTEFAQKKLVLFF